MRLPLVLAAVAALAGPARAEPAALYGRWCARCHGERGDGRGPAAAALAFNGQPPRDFTTGRFRWKSTPQGTGPTDEDLAGTIARGIPATSMPYFEDLLAADEIGALVGVVRGFATTPPPPGRPIDLGPPVDDSPPVRARGAELYTALGCFACHGSSGAGDGPSAAALRNDDGTPARPADLTRPWTFRGGAGAADVALRLATGIAGTPMPAYLDTVPIADLWALARHVGALARAPNLREAAISRAKAPPGAGEAPVARGEYLAKSGTCFLCHAQMHSDGSYVETAFGVGGMAVELAWSGRVFTRNLTPDPGTGLGGWTAADLRRALRDGRSRDGRALSALDMPWTILARLTDGDIDGLHAYLASLPPVQNLVPAPEAAGLVPGVGGKLAALLTGARMYGSYHPGNAGRVPAPGEQPAPVANPGAELLVLAAGGAVLLIVTAMWRRLRPWGALVIVLVAVGVPLVYTWPPLRFLPPTFVRGHGRLAGVAVRLGLPPLRPPPAPTAVTDPDLRLLAGRGRYVATFATCPLCHTAGPDPLRLREPFPDLGGGMKVAWRVFGTTWSRNLTPDDETGLGRWTEREIRRAIVSGIARDGRQMHWQAMPWDHFSNLSPEDLEALVAYLRHLPAVHSRVPDPVPPGPADPAGDTFHFGYEGEYRPRSDGG